MKQYSNSEKVEPSKQGSPVKLYGFGSVGKGVVGLWNQITSNQQISDVHVKSQEAVPFGFSGSWKKNEQEVDREGTVIDAMADTQKSIRLMEGLSNENLEIVSASKDAIAQAVGDVPQNSKLRYEAAVAGSIPIITLIDEYYQYHNPIRFQGILNGSCNFILGQLEQKKNYDSALKQAQELGFAEADPTFDVSGKDTLNKLVIVGAHLFGLNPEVAAIPLEGIQGLPLWIVEQAIAEGKRVKLVANLEKTEKGISAWIWPTIVSAKSALYQVNDEYNGVTVETQDLGEQFLKGKGAGSYPTAGAIGLDLRKLNLKQTYNKLPHNTAKLSQDFEVVAKVFYAENKIETKKIPLTQLVELNKQVTKEGARLLLASD